MINELAAEIGGAAQATVNGRELHHAIRYGIGSYLGFVEERIAKLSLMEGVDYSVTVEDDVSFDYLFSVGAANRMMQPLGSEVVSDAPSKAGESATGVPAARESKPKRKAKPAQLGTPNVSPRSGRKVDPRQCEFEF